MEKTIAAPAKEPPRTLWVWRRLACLALLAAGCTAAWMGGWTSLLGVGLAVAAALLALPQPAAPTGDAASPAQAAADGRTGVAIHTVLPTGAAAVPGGQRLGAEVMVSQVVPVWSRQLEVTRDAASDGLGALLQTFAEISQQLQTLSSSLSSFSVSATPGSVDQAVRAESPALQALTAASSRAFAERDEAVGALGRCGEGLSELQHLAKQARELSRHTRLVAFNASIESNRGPAGAGRGGGRQAENGGSQAVAGELRMLAGRIGENSEQIERVINGLMGTVRKARREGEVADTSAEELQLEIDISARKALAALLGSLGASMQSSTEVKQAAETLNAQIETAFMSFQFGDRISQMLSIVANDMGNFARWVAANPRASQMDAAEWLAALESSYTMEEQRSSHHGNVHVDAGAAVEFF